MKKNIESPIFIVGTQRSGTTLIGRMIASHSKIFIRNESPELIYALKNNKQNEDVVEIMMQNICASCSSDGGDTLSALGKTRWGFKDPALTHCLDRLLELFPLAKIIFIVRDGRAVAISKLKARFGTGNIYHAARSYNEEVTIQKTFFEKHRNRCFWMNYEQLLMDPDLILKQVCSFLGEEYEQNMLRYYETNNYIDEVNEFNINTFKKLDIKKINKWKDELSSFQIDVFESVAGNTLISNGYDLIGNQITLSPFMTKLFEIHQRIMFEFQIQYQTRIKPFIKKKKWKLWKNI